MSAHTGGPVLGVSVRHGGFELPRAVRRLRPASHPHFAAYTLGNALFWILWATLSVSADPWYWWLVIPAVGWTAVFVGHRRGTRPAG